jgi:predicted acylesterase/phospholipase RssA
VSLSWLRASAVGLLVLLAACATMPRVPFTAEEQALASVPGIPDARFWSDDPPPLLREGVRALMQARAAPAVLALSGGGADGAFGAGLLVGWSQAGTRPTFGIVSGVSAGALIAPFAFLGPAYDPVLQEALTGGYAAELGQFNDVVAILSYGLLRPEPLRRLVARFVDQDVLDGIADEHRRGRRLFVVTTNLDAQRSVVWNLGAVAASARADRLALFRAVLVASASIPGVFAPVLIDVEARGRRFAELHVDGGVTHNIFVVPDPVVAFRNLLPARLPGQIFVVVNNKLVPDFEVVENRTLPVVARSLSTTVKTSTIRVLLSTYQFARAHGLGFNLAAIDPAYPTSTTIGFDQRYMLALFQHGFERGRAGPVWQRSILPPAPSPDLNTPERAGGPARHSATGRGRG